MQKSPNSVKVWDPVVRLGHWILVAAFFTAYLTEDELMTAHAWAGYAVGGVIVLRLIWGFVGTRHARFTDFVRSPASVVRYVRDLPSRPRKRYLGHNPAGGAMIVLLLLSVAGIVHSGLMVHAYENQAGPLAAWVADAGLGAHAVEEAEDFWEETHEFLANFTLLLIVLHITGGLLSSYLYRENLIKAMFTGRKRSPG